MKIIYNILYAIVYLVSFLPMSILYAIAKLVYVVVYYFIGYRRDITIQNLSRSFPEKNYKEIKKTAKAFYFNFSNYMVEILKSISAPMSFYKEKIVFKNFDIVRELLNEGKTVLAGMGHMTNWEILNILPQHENIPCYAVYKTQTIRGMDALMHKIRSRFGMKLITSDEVGKYLLSKKNPVAMYIFIADQTPMYQLEDEKITFLHQRTQMFNGLEKIGKKINASIIYLDMRQTKRGHYIVECKYLGNADTLSEKGQITKAFAQHLEENILAQPEGWLWTHKRWKR